MVPSSPHTGSRPSPRPPQADKPRQSPAPPRTGWVRSQAGATRNHPNPELPSKAQPLPQHARLTVTFPAPRRHRW